MEIITLSIDQINAVAYNPRIDLQPGDSEYEKLKRSIAEFGYIDPIIWNRRTGNMVGGHQRYKIMVHEMGAAELPVSVVDLDEQQERILNITLNKVGGGWDEHLLTDLLTELRVEGIDLTITGFDDHDVDSLIQEYSKLPEDQQGDFHNKELDVSEFNPENFDCVCPRCGFVFDKESD